MPQEIYYATLSSAEVFQQTVEFVRQVQLREKQVVRPPESPSWIEKIKVPEVSSEINVNVGEISNPNDFYLVRNDCLEEYVKLQENLANYYQKGHHAITIDPAELYAAKLPPQLGSLWGRVVILNSTSSRFYQCMFIDLGYTCCLKYSDLYLLSPHFLSTIPRTFKASLYGVLPRNGFWSDSETTFFHEMVVDKPLRAYVEKQEHGVCHVFLIHNTANINEEFQSFCQSQM